MSQPTTLVLWDIDHTLLSSGGLGAMLNAIAFRQTTGIAMRQQAEVTGRTEKAILADTLRLHGLEPSQRIEDKYARALAGAYHDHAEALAERGHALPGAADALAALTTVPSTVQTVLTGNFRAVAVIKLRTFGLEARLDLDIGAYGEDDVRRSRLVALAWSRAGQRHGHVFAAGHTLILGDSIHDMRAGRDSGARAIGVATGTATARQLTDAGADAVLPDLTDTGRLRDLVKTLLGHARA